MELHRAGHHLETEHACKNVGHKTRKYRFDHELPLYESVLCTEHAHTCAMGMMAHLLNTSEGDSSSCQVLMVLVSTSRQTNLHGTAFNPPFVN